VAAEVDVSDRELPETRRIPMPHELDEDADDGDLGAGTEPLPADVIRRVAHALAYLRDTKPGKRYVALAALWRACTGLEDVTDWRLTDARRTYVHVEKATRTIVRVVVASLGADPDRATSTAAARFLGRLRELDSAKPVPIRRQSCSICGEKGHNRMRCPMDGP
jgi:hypothetical protein